MERVFNTKCFNTRWYFIFSNRRGNYYVIVTDANGCTQTSNSVLFNETSIGEAAISEIKIYPKPFRDEATIDLGKSVSDIVVRGNGYIWKSYRSNRNKE